jgi:hypothetical protein
VTRPDVALAVLPVQPLRVLVVSLVAFAAICLVVIADYTGYPGTPSRFWVFQYLLRTQDVAGSLLLIGLVLAACFAPAGRVGLRFVDALSHHPWRAAGLTFVALCLGSLYVEHNHPLAQDEYAALFQSRVFAEGRLTGQFPPDLIGRLIAPIYLNHFLFGSLQTGEVASAYWPGFALLLTPFTVFGIPWACNPLLASAALVLMGALAERLSGAKQARGWAMLFALGSPAFTAMAITYFSMTAHLLLNLAFAWLVLGRTPLRLFLAGLLGAWALVLHNPVPHALFALPWVVWLALQPQPLRHLLPLAAGYVPLGTFLGLGWGLVLSGVQGATHYGLYPDAGAQERVANFIWEWFVRVQSALSRPGERQLAMRFAELARLWCWAVPGLLLFAAAGWWLSRRISGARLLGISLVSTFAGFLLVGFDQGYGWSARYFHSAWGVLPVLAGIALATDASPRWWSLARYVAGLALLSAVLATALRAGQIHHYVSAHLAQRPATLAGVRQIVFVRYDPVNYTADLVQNDPFLRGNVWYLFSLGPRVDEQLMHRRFPGARLVSRDARGETWRLD